MSTYADASLIYYPSGYKAGMAYSLKPTDGSGDLTFTRASSATRVNAEGLIEDVEIILPTELIVNGDFENGSTGWSLVGDFAISGGKASITSASQYSQLTSQGTNFLIAGKQYKLQLDIDTLSKDNAFAYRFSGGAVTPILTSQIVDGKFEANFTMPSNGYLWLQTTGSYTGLNVSIDNVSVKEVITNNIPRIDYTGGGCGKLLLEPQRTNNLSYSQDFANVYWAKSDITFGADGVSPSGLTDADLLVTGVANSDQIQKSVTLSATNTITQSVFIKRVAGADWVDFITVRLGFSNSVKVWFNISTGAVGSSIQGGTTSLNSASIEDYGSGWLRLIVTTTDSTNNTNFDTRIRTATANLSDTRVNNSSYYLWGFQVESSATYATSYIPTTSTAVTRVADSAAKSGISSLIGQTEGTIFWEGSIDNFANFATLLVLEGTSNSWIYCLSYSGGLTFEVRSNNVLTASYLTTFTTGSHKIAVAYNASQVAIYIDGVSVFTDNSVTIPATSNLYLGGWSGYNQAVKTAQALLFKTRLSNAQLASLTTL